MTNAWPTSARQANAKRPDTNFVSVCKHLGRGATNPSRGAKQRNASRRPCKPVPASTERGAVAVSATRRTRQDGWETGEDGLRGTAGAEGRANGVGRRAGWVQMQVPWTQPLPEDGLRARAAMG